MTHRSVDIAGAICVCFGALGCAHSDWSVMKSLSPEPSIPGTVKVKTPGNPNIPLAHLETTERVETLAKRIVSQNPFTGIEPIVYVLGVKESVLFHRGSQELFISEGLVKKCKTEAELAAVLSTELGQMMAEKRSVARTADDRDTIPSSALPGGISVAGGAPADLGREAEVAFHERRHPRSARSDAAKGDTVAKLARELLKGAGFDEAEFDRVKPLVQQSERGTALRKQMSNSAAPPTWDK